MNRSLIWYNLSYYARSLRFIAPCLVFVVFHFSIHSQMPIPIWGQYHLGAVGVFVFSNWIGSSFINSEDRTQQYITMLHVKNETLFHISKIISILVFMIPFYMILITYPLAFGFFERSLLFTELLAVAVIHFLFSLMGASVGAFFNADFHNKKTLIPLQALVVLVMVVPPDMFLGDNALARFVAYLLPPLNFFGDRLNTLSSGVFVMDGNFLLFILRSAGYSLALIAVYIFLIKKRNKH